MNQHDPELTLISTTSSDDKLESALLCEQCREPFKPRKGGKPQRFCSETCRMAFHSEAREADKATIVAFKQRATLPMQPAATMTPELPPVATGGFDWLNDNSVVLREQPETAVYFNADGALVIRQRAAWNQDDDPFVFINPANLGEFIDKLTDICGVPSVGRA
jgi:hypothetical protein